MDIGGGTGPRSRLFLTSVLTLLPVGVALFVDILEDVTLFVTALVLLGAFVIALFGNYFLVYAPAVTFRNRQLTSFLDHHLEMLVTDYKRRNDVDCNVRANVMVPQYSRSVTHRGGLDFGWGTQEYLQITYHSDGYGKFEVNREWEFGQGCCGEAFVANEQVAAEQKSDDEDWGRAWGTTPEQDRATAHLCSVVSTPIYKPTDRQREEPVAVLNLDSEAPSSESGFEQEEIQDQIIEEYAAEIGTLL